MLLDFRVDVAAFASQPFWLSWRHGDRTRRHAPDFFARLADGTGVVVDVRPDDRIEQADAEAFDATARACAEVGWLFHRVGTPDPVLAANLRWLARYRHPRCGVRRDVVESLVGVFARPTGNNGHGHSYRSRSVGTFMITDVRARLASGSTRLTYFARPLT